MSPEAWAEVQRRVHILAHESTAERSKFERDLDRWYEMCDEAREPKERSDDEGE